MLCKSGPFIVSSNTGDAGGVRQDGVSSDSNHTYIREDSQ